METLESFRFDEYEYEYEYESDRMGFGTRIQERQVLLVVKTQIVVFLTSFQLAVSIIHFKKISYSTV